MPLIQTSCCPIWFADHRKEAIIETPLLLIHGAGGTHLDWSLPLRRMGAIAPDLPGHGKSPAPGFQRIEDYARAIVAFMDALGIEKAVIGGHSMGGAIAQMMALEHPERVERLLLIGTSPRMVVSPEIMNGILVDQAKVGELLKAWMWGEKADERMKEIGFQQFMRTDPAIIHGDYAACNAFDVRERLESIRAKTLIIAGTQDRMTPHKFSVTLAEKIPQAELVTIQDAGHMMGLEQPEVVGDAVRAWLVSH